MTAPTSAALATRSFSPVRTRSRVPERRPPGPRETRTMKVVMALDVLEVTRRRSIGAVNEA